LKDHRQRVNDQIKISPLRVIGTDGEQLGILERDEALRIAGDASLDLVEVAPHVRPPVCRIMDYGKYKYEQSKKSHKSRARSHEVKQKEIRVRPKTETHDLEFKIRRARDFLDDGDKVMVNMLFRGRELTHLDFAAQNMQAFVEALSDIATVERGPSREGRRMILVLAPNKKKNK